MKKLLTLLVAGTIFTAATFAQTKTTAAAPKQEAKKEMKKAEAKAAPAKAEAMKPVAAAKAETKMKKDGTPDMRVKENKAKVETKAAAGPMKKDGTPDMRFKENKEKKADAKAPKKG